MIIIGCLIGVLFINAQEVYKQNTNVDLKVSCLTASDQLCDGHNCTLSILFSNESYLIKEQNMTQDNLIFNLTINSTQTSEIDDYKGLASCFNGSTYGTEEFLFSITPNGQRTTLEGSIIQIGLLMLLVLFLAMTILGHFKFTNQAVKTGLFLLSYGLVTLIFGMAWLISASYLSIDIFTTILHSIFLILIYGLFPLVIFVIAMFFIHVVQEQKLAKQVKRGLRVRRDRK